MINLKNILKIINFKNNKNMTTQTDFLDHEKDDIVDTLEILERRVSLSKISLKHDDWCSFHDDLNLVQALLTKLKKQIKLKI